MVRGNGPPSGSLPGSGANPIYPVSSSLVFRYVARGVHHAEGAIPLTEPEQNLHTAGSAEWRHWAVIQIASLVLRLRGNGRSPNNWAPRGPDE